MAAPLAANAVLVTATVVTAREPFTKEELKAMDSKLTASVKRGYDMWWRARADMANNGLACANCHSDAAATNPHTLPKYMPQTDKVMAYRDRVNWCIENAQDGNAPDMSSADIVALEADSCCLPSGLAIDTGLQTRETAGPTPKSARGLNLKGAGLGFDQ